MKTKLLAVALALVATPAWAFDLVMDTDTSSGVALSEVPVNLYPLVDATDGVTIEDAIVYNQAGMDLRWNFVTSAGSVTSTAVTPTTAGDYDWTHQGDGIYTIEIPASGGASINNATEGYGWFSGNTTASAPWRGPVIMFVETSNTSTGLLGQSDIDRSNGVLKGYEQIATYSSQTSFTLTTGPADNDALNGHICIIHEDGTDDRQVGIISDYVGSTKTVTLAADPGVFTFDGNDYVVIVNGSADMVAAGGSKAAADNISTAGTNYDANRGLGGQALPNAAADAAGGLPISDAGGLDLDTQILTDIDAILVATAEIGAAGAGLTEAGGTGDQLTAVPWNAAWDAEVESEVDDSIGGGTGTALTGVPWTSWAATVDGKTLSDIMHYLGAVFMGDRTIVDNGATQTTTYDGMDGTAGRVISTTNKTTKARTIDTLNGTP